MLENWLFPQLETDPYDFNFQQYGAPPLWRLDVPELLNNRIPQRWIGHTGTDDSVKHHWPPISPNLSVCDFFLWEFINDYVYVSPLPETLSELKTRRRAAVYADMLQKVWNIFDLRNIILEHDALTPSIERWRY
ncbi:hypothetical protein AVEN_153810-1 [Araneus ventricosus]|uniref:Uncharacterized protein n=1 Tax=Araneus ventricosus TaxID=182803 RepID=A0A4Y2WEM0_ARAVE|nr:hypothetical protein AVEN_153810-1 [Araneus ventricosus]